MKITKDAGMPKTNGRMKRSRHREFFALLLGVVFLICVYALVITTVSPQKFVLSVGDIAPETITAPHETVNQAATAKLRQQAMDLISPIYSQDMKATSKALESLDGYFTAITLLRGRTDEVKTQKVTSFAQQNTPEQAAEYEKSDKWIEELTDADFTAIKDGFPLQLFDDEVTALIKTSKSDIERMDTEVRKMMESALEQGIKQEHRLDIIASIKTEMDTALEGTGRVLLGVAKKGVEEYLPVNMVYDEKLTLAAKEKAASAIVPATIKTGQNIVVKGEEVTQEQYDIMESLGLLGPKGENIWFYVGLGLFIAGLTVPLGLYIYYFQKDIIARFTRLAFLLIILLIVIAAALPLSKIQIRLIPVFMATLLISMAFGIRTSIMATAYLAFVTSAMAGEGNVQNFFNCAAVFISGSVGAFSMRRVQHRSRIMIGGAASGILYALLNLGLGYVTGRPLEESLVWAGWAVVGGIACAVLTLGTLPIWEAVFRLATPSRLLELSNTHQPLLKKLMIEAPGTYNHSIMVANLSEAAAEVTGADTLLCRVGAYYHDVGKLKEPLLFVENQMGNNNPHDTLPPDQSAELIRGHVEDGMKYAKRFKLPKSIQDIISQHHGTSQIAYFYHKAKTMGEGEIDPKKFKYPGPRPQTREAAIIMLADTVEAAIRALKDVSVQSIEDAVENLIKDRLYTGQLDESPLTLRDMEKIKSAFTKVLSGIYHGRVEYPKRDAASERGNED